MAKYNAKTQYLVVRIIFTVNLKQHAAILYIIVIFFYISNVE